MTTTSSGKPYRRGTTGYIAFGVGGGDKIITLKRAERVLTDSELHRLRLFWRRLEDELRETGAIFGKVNASERQ